MFLLRSFFQGKFRFIRSAVICVALSFILLFFNCSVFGMDAKEPKRVLLLYAYGKEEGFYVDVDRTVRSRLRVRVPDRVVFYTEYLDLARFPDPSHADTVAELLRLRLAEEQPDLIMPMGYAALSFLLKNGKDLFPNTPIVTVFNERRIADLKLGPETRPRFTGLTTKDEAARTLDLALQLQ